MLDISLLGKRLREHRIKKGLTSEQLAEQIGVSTVFIRDVERGIKCVRMDNFVKICNILECTSDELLCDSVEADTKLLLNEVTKKMQHLNSQQIASVSKVVDAVINEFCTGK